ncbi:MAG: 2,3,4,5-tetrahydropyridine-2,6-dicarboxylate N-succinyltransferase [Bacteroidales bacterium]
MKMDIGKLKEEFELLSKEENEASRLTLFYKVRPLLEGGQLRVAEKIEGEWKINSWIKSVILWGFKYGKMKEYSSTPLPFYDKDTYPPRSFDTSDNIRIVPGGSSVRSGAYVAEGTVIMPPSYINVGAYIDSGTMIDSNALVGSCAQIGKGVHLSAASQIGGVLEPVGALPVIVEDDVFIGGNCGIYEGTIIEKGAVIASGVILTGSTPIFDSTTGEFIGREEQKPLMVPAGAVVVAGSRPVERGEGKRRGIQLYTPVIVKYRDSQTALSTTLEEILR